MFDVTNYLFCMKLHVLNLHVKPFILHILHKKARRLQSFISMKGDDKSICVENAKKDMRQLSTRSSVIFQRPDQMSVIPQRVSHYVVVTALVVKALQDHTR